MLDVVYNKRVSWREINHQVCCKRVHTRVTCGLGKGESDAAPSLDLGELDPAVRPPHLHLIRWSYPCLPCASSRSAGWAGRGCIIL